MPLQEADRPTRHRPCIEMPQAILGTREMTTGIEEIRSTADGTRQTTYTAARTAMACSMACSSATCWDTR